MQIYSPPSTCTTEDAFPSPAVQVLIQFPLPARDGGVPGTATIGTLSLRLPLQSSEKASIYEIKIELKIQAYRKTFRELNILAISILSQLQSLPHHRVCETFTKGLTPFQIVVEVASAG